MFSQLTKQNSQKGTTLVELLVAVGLFAIVMLLSTGTLIMLMGANQKAQSLESAVNNLNFALDSMTRTIRTGYDYYCDSSGADALPSGTGDCEAGGTRIVLTNDQDERVGYRFEGSSIERKIDSGNWLSLTATELEITDMRFYVTGATASDALQPIVTLAISGNAGEIENTDTTFYVQTTVTQRLLDVPE